MPEIDIPKVKLPEQRTDPESGREYLVYSNGAERWVDNGQIKKQMDITPIMADPAGMQKRGQQLQRERAIVAQLRGLAGASEALPADADLEQIAKGALTAIEALTRHFAKQFLQSSNIRGMAESYAKLVTPLLNPGGTSDDIPSNDETHALIREIADALRYRETVNGKVIE